MRWRLVGKAASTRSEVVFSGAGAAALSCAAHYVRLGVRRENIIMCDIHGVVYKGPHRGHEPLHGALRRGDRRRTLAEALEGADVFVGLSARQIVTPEMLHGHGARPDHFRPGQSRSRDPLRRGRGGAARTRSWPPAARIFPTR